MKHQILYAFILANLLLISSSSKSQTVSNVLEDGIVIKSGKHLFLDYSEQLLRYNIAQVLPQGKPYKDSTLFLVVNDNLFVYRKPVNPLNFSFTSNLEFKVDPINESVITAVSSIQSFLATQAEPPKAGGNMGPESSCSFLELETLYAELNQLAQKDLKNSIREVFTSLKNITFEQKVNTIAAIETSKKTMAPLLHYINQIDAKIKNLDSLVNKFECSNSQRSFIIKYVFADALANVRTIRNQQKARVDNLQKAYEAVEAMKDLANSQKDGFDNNANTWFIKFTDIPINKGKLSYLTVTVYESGFKLSENNEIVEMEKKELSKNTLIFRRFQRFVAEPSAGVAFTQISFPDFGTTTDGAGNLVVAEAGRENFKRVNFTAMLNLNYYIQNSNVNPFFQIGVGANTDYPTLFTGVGLRLNFSPLRRAAIAVGLASTWIKTLQTFKVGDIVGGEADVKNDLKHEFKWPMKPYIGIQLNL